MTEDEIAISMTVFGQVEDHLTKTREGTGLGLPLARKLTELHDGQLVITSKKRGHCRDRVVTRQPRRPARGACSVTETVAVPTPPPDRNAILSLPMGDYLQPTNLNDALAALAGRRLTVLAGGTDIYPARVGKPFDEDILDISRIDGLRGIDERDDHFRIGALTTWSDLSAADLPPMFDGLRQAAREIGGVQVQNSGTIGGNICNASPAADGVPPLLTLDAELETASVRERRRSRSRNSSSATARHAARRMKSSLRSAYRRRAGIRRVRSSSSVRGAIWSSPLPWSLPFWRAAKTAMSPAPVSPSGPAPPRRSGCGSLSALWPASLSRARWRTLPSPHICRASLL